MIEPGSEEWLPRGTLENMDFFGHAVTLPHASVFNRPHTFLL